MDDYRSNDGYELPDGYHERRDALIAGAVKRGRFLRTRRRLTALGVACAVIAVPVTAFAVTNDSGRDEVTTVPPSSTTPERSDTTTTTLPSATTTVALPDIPPPAGSASGPSTPRTAAPATTPTTALVCRNSKNPDCGAWFPVPDPRPNDATMVLTSLDDQTPAVGQVVTLTVEVSDPDASVDFDCYRLDWGDGTIDESPVGPDCTSFARSGDVCETGAYGPWDQPPDPGYSKATRTFTHVYSSYVYLRRIEVIVRGDECTPLGNYNVMYWYGTGRVEAFMASP